MKKEIVGRGWVFPPQIGSQGIALTHEENELTQSIYIILGTAIGERVMRPTFGCRIHDLIFAPNNLDTAARAREYVREALNMWEPRIKVIEVLATPDYTQSGHTLMISITYEVKTNNDQRSLVYPFYLIPEE